MRIFFNMKEVTPMTKVGRNDSCPCGSGKKYKKCCEKKTIVSVEQLVRKELGDIQKEIIHFALSQYKSEIDEYVKPNIVESNDSLYYFSVLSFITTVKRDNGKTILEEYVENSEIKSTRQKTVDIVASWKAATLTVSVVERIDEQANLHVRNVVTNEHMTVRALDAVQKTEVGSLVFGTILPNEEEYIFFVEMLTVTREKANSISSKLLSQSEPEKYLQSNFIELIKWFLLDEPDTVQGLDDVLVKTEDMEWNTASQKEVAQILEDNVARYWGEEAFASLGISLWEKFCHRKNPRIQKPVLYVGALIYLIDKLGPYSKELTQSGIAEDFGITSSSISAKYKDLVSILEEEILAIKQDFNEMNLEVETTS